MTRRQRETLFWFAIAFLAGSAWCASQGMVVEALVAAVPVVAIVPILLIAGERSE